MLSRTSIAQIKFEEISKADGLLVVAMRVYPRFLPKTLIHEYSKDLSPDPALFARYREHKKQGRSQNDAFRLAGYEQKFTLSSDSMSALKRLAEISRSQNVFLICQCSKEEHCHVDLMLLLAESHFGASIGDLADGYLEFRARLPSTPTKS